MKKETLYTTDFRRLKAEVALDLLYPDADAFAARNKGNFYRNYSPDLLAIDEFQHEIELSRDGVLKSLPDTYLAPEKSTESYDQMQQRLGILSDAFLPIDSAFLKQYIEAQRQADSLMANKSRYILSTYFDYDIDNSPNIFVKEMAYLLPFVHLLRGKIGLIRNMLAYVLNEKVTTGTYPYSTSDTTRGYIPKTLFVVWKEGLDDMQYVKLKKELEVTMQFVSEWFLPYDHVFEIEICNFTDNQNDILNYNTILTD